MSTSIHSKETVNSLSGFLLCLRFSLFLYPFTSELFLVICRVVKSYFNFRGLHEVDNRDDARTRFGLGTEEGEAHIVIPPCFCSAY